MIIQPKGSKEQTSLMDLLGGSSKTADSKSNGMFSRLLASLGAQAKPGAAQIVSSDFKAVVDPRKAVVQAADVPKTAGPGELQALLKGSGETEEDAFISAELLDTLSKDQVRTLIHQAKEYLKNEITAKAPEYLKETEALPKSLMGLVHLADKLGLEPQSITLSTLMPETEPLLPPELLSKPLLATEAISRLSTAAHSEESAPTEAITQLLGDIKNKDKKDPKSPATSSEPLRTEQPGQTEQPLKALLQSLDKRDAAQSGASVPEEKKKETPQNIPAQPKSEGLMALLQGENEPSAAETDENGNLRTDTEASKIAQTPKADSLEVKSKEAQQSMRYFASDLKEAVENYKPPFTRLTMKLNPEQLGEVEVTLVQRGNNVHVNIQSGNANSIAFLAHNASELKAQLAHQGITNATMNFMGGENQHSQGQQHQPQQHRFQTYQSLAELELNEEQLSALEIIIPHYA